MGKKMLWLGLTLIQVDPLIHLPVPAVAVVGAVIMVFGCLLYIFDK